MGSQVLGARTCVVVRGCEFQGPTEEADLNHMKWIFMKMIAGKCTIRKKTINTRNPQKLFQLKKYLLMGKLKMDSLQFKLIPRQIILHVELFQFQFKL